ncbi:diguanylate cyclase domain-containing protein [Neptunicella sp. SCSIO 80796]|uniref:diguanylate cyclase domain-containing protein n=1 Tax=Neptunicella plasticusilytica TaxID=3117012 RepID=UPI003A4D7E3F
MPDNSSLPQTNAPIDKRPQSSNRRGASLSTFFTVILISVLALLTTIASIIYYQLNQFQHILDDITDKSIPAMVHSNKVNSQVNSLTYLIEGLTQASSQASRRIANQEIQTKVTEIMEMIEDNQKEDYLLVHIESMTTELESLNRLIEQKLELKNQINEQKVILYQIYAEVMDYMLKPDNSSAHTSIAYIWAIELSNVVTTSSEALTLNRINDIRQISQRIQNLLDSQQNKIDQLPANTQARAAGIITQLRQTLLEPQGLIPMRMEQLRIIGRAVGRGHFVRNLVNDLANLAEFQSFEHNNAVQGETLQTNQQIKQQIRYMGMMSLLAALFLLAIVFLIRQRVVKRLNILNKKVQGRISGGSEELMIRGNDEISDIAQSFNYFVQIIEQQKLKLQDLSLTDGLTGIANRRALDERLFNNIQSAKRHQWPLSVLLMDVDFFKPYNDNYGHAKGDKCLQEIAYVLTSNKRREEDFIARYGGEEFVYLLPQSDEQGATQIAEIILEAMAEQNIPHQFSHVAPYVTVSIGIATYNFEQPISGDELLKNADQALYQAKRQGKNRFVFFNSET